MTQDAIVIGAGLSGLVAAQTLADQGYTVSVFETEDRVGGRIHTITTPEGYPVDVGASFVPSPESIDPAAKALHALLHQNHIRLKKVDFLNADAFNSAGHRENLNALAPLLWEYFNDANMRIQNAKITNSNKSIADILQYDKEHIPPLDSLEYLAQKIITTIFIKRFGTALNNISLMELQNYSGNHYSHFEDDFVYLASHGLQPLVDALYQKAIATKKIQFNLNSKIVTVKRLENTNEVVVYTASSEKISAETVILAVPLGILQKKGITFTPPLSVTKERSLQHLRTGTHNRVVLTFQKPFWPKDVHFLYPGDSKIDYWPTYLNLYHFSEGKTATLVADLYAAQGYNLEHTNTLVEKALAPLQKIYKNIPPPIFTYVSKWDVSPFFGSLSYFGGRTKIEDPLSIRKPEKNLLFAGEYSTEHKNTLTGAYESGIRSGLEAGAFLKWLRNHKPVI